MTLTKKYLTKGFWLIIVLLSAYYLYRGIRFRFFTEDNLVEKVFWYYFHLFTAIAPLILGPFQFWTWLRINRPSFHRMLGKIYLIGSLLGGISSLYLGITIDLEGSIVPLFLLSSTWIFMTLAAWVTIKNNNINGHRQFAIRSYALAMVFVFLRLIGDIPQDRLFFFIQSPEIRDSTLEWVSWIIPLLVIELIFSWIPLLRTKKVRTKI